jgi:hypothetical protein
MAEGPLHCDAAFIPPATRDTVRSVFETGVELSGGSSESRLPELEFAYRFGSRAELETALSAAAAADSAAAATRLAFLLRSTDRPASGAAAARYLALVYAESLKSADRDGLVTALFRDGDVATASRLVHSPAAGPGDSSPIEPYIAGLAGYGRYRELWDYTRQSPRSAPEVYFRHALTSALAAAHFDLAAARARLAHEADNAGAFPAPAREVLTALAALLAAEPAPAEAWAALATHPFCTSQAFETVRLLLHTHALRLDPKRVDSAAAVTDELERSAFGRPAAECQERLAAELEATDPAREHALRRSAQGFFAIEADRECRAVLSRIAVPEPTDRLIDGAAAFRLGERQAAMAALEEAKAATGGPPALAWTAKRLQKAAAELPAR